MGLLSKNPRVFIGSSKEGQEKARFLASALLDRNIEPLPWFDFFKEEDRPPLQELERISLAIECAIMIATSDDRTIIREREWSQMRDNVLFEYGLFSGRLGRNKCALMLPSEDDFRIPSDFLGLACLEHYRPILFHTAAQRVADKVIEIVSKSLPKESTSQKAKRLLQAIGWIRDRAFRTIMAIYESPNPAMIFKQLEAITEFLRPDAKELEITEQLDNLAYVLKEAFYDFPQFPRRDSLEDWMQVKYGSNTTGRLINYFKLARATARYHCPLGAKCVCRYRRSRGGRKSREIRTPLPFPLAFLVRQEQFKNLCPCIAWSYGAVETTALQFLVMENAFWKIRQWTELHAETVNDSIATFERKLHESIFGGL
jgi:Predicted nucleotide-binding protein containing TIR-like domain